MEVLSLLSLSAHLFLCSPFVAVDLFLFLLLCLSLIYLFLFNCLCYIKLLPVGFMIHKKSWRLRRQDATGEKEHFICQDHLLATGYQNNVEQDTWCILQ